MSKNTIITYIKCTLPFDLVIDEETFQSAYDGDINLLMKDMWENNGIGIADDWEFDRASIEPLTTPHEQETTNKDV